MRAQRRLAKSGDKAGGDKRLISAVFAVAALFAATKTAHADIVIGLAIPAAGREQADGDSMRRAAQSSVDDLNAKGGLLGERLSLSVADDRCSDAGAISAANSFVHMGAKLVIGHPCARAALAAAQIYGPANTLFIATATRHAALTDKRAGKTIFRLSGRDDQQPAIAAEWMLGQLGAGPFAIIHDKTAYSRGLSAGVAAALVAKKQIPPLDFPITAGENVYASVIAKLKDVRPRAVFFAGYPAEADIIVTALRGAGLTVPVLGSDSLATREFTTQRAATDPGVAVLTRFNPQPFGGLEPLRVGAQLDPTGGPALQAHARYTAAAITSWAEAVRRAASCEAERAAVELNNPAAGAANGTATFDPKGDASVVSFFAVHWDGKGWVASGN